MSAPLHSDAVPDTGPLSTDWESVCDRFEDEFRAGGTPDIATALSTVTPELRPRLLAELLTIECWWYKRRGHIARPEDYLPRFPDYVETIVAAFSPLMPLSSTLPTAALPAMTTKQALDVGSTLGPYHLVAKLGEGGMGVVFRAIHTKLDKVVAVKILSASFMHHPDAAARFQREMKAVGRVNHPHVVQAFDAGEIDGTHYLAMEFVDGQDLDTIVSERGRLPLATACRIIREAADALSAAHAAGLVHRDIKPSNLLLDHDGRVKLLDLGLSRLLARDDKPSTDLTTLGQVFGTADYMAPEQWDDPRKADARSDLYALGCTLFHLLSGQPPFASGEYQTVFSKMQGHVSTPIPELTDFAPQTPATVIEVCHRLMSKRPEDRFTAANDVVQALASFAQAQIVLPPLLSESTGDERRPSTSFAHVGETDYVEAPRVNAMPPTTHITPDASDAPIARKLVSSTHISMIRAGLVLLADDNPYDRQAFCRLIERLGHKVIEAENGEQALELLAQHPVDLILLDLKMPVMSGEEVFEQLHSSDRLQKIPVLILSGSASDTESAAEVARFVALGAEDYLQKNGDPRLLEARVMNSLTKKLLRDEQQQTLQTLKRQRNNIDKLLNALLPHHIKARILADFNESGKFAVEPQRYYAAAVMHVGWVGFSEFCEQKTPREVVDELHSLVTALEQVCLQHNLEKIKTIGSSFLATAGLNSFAEQPVRNCLEAAQAMMTVAAALTPAAILRVGIDYGSVIAGVVGTSKFQFDVWGQTVDTALALEQTGEPGRIHLSAAAWREVEDDCRGDVTMRELPGRGKQPVHRFRQFTDR